MQVVHIISENEKATKEDEAGRELLFCRAQQSRRCPWNGRRIFVSAHRSVGPASLFEAPIFVSTQFEPICTKRKPKAIISVSSRGTPRASVTWRADRLKQFHFSGTRKLFFQSAAQHPSVSGVRVLARRFRDNRFHLLVSIEVY